MCLNLVSSGRQESDERRHARQSRSDFVSVTRSLRCDESDAKSRGDQQFHISADSSCRWCFAKQRRRGVFWSSPLEISPLGPHN